MLNRESNFAQYLVNEIVIDFNEGKNLTDFVNIKFDENSKRIIHYGSGSITAWDLMKHLMQLIYPNKREESIEFDCLKLLSNLSVTDLAQLCNISKQAISQMIKGQRKPSQKVLDAIKKYLNIL